MVSFGNVKVAAAASTASFAPTAVRSDHFVHGNDYQVMGEKKMNGAVVVGSNANNNLQCESAAAAATGNCGFAQLRDKFGRLLTGGSSNKLTRDKESLLSAVLMDD